MGRTFLTSESVTEGHPDKVADRISDAVLDAILANDRSAHVACETFLTTGLVLVGGEISTSTYVDVDRIARRVIAEVGYDKAGYGFSHQDCAVLSTIKEQSAEIAEAVGKKGPGVFALPGLVKITVVKKPATPKRKGINPFTKQEQVFAAKPARKVIKVRPLKALKDMAK